MANLNIIEKENLVEQSAINGAYFHDKLRATVGSKPYVGQIRGEGMLAAVQLMADATNKQFFDPKVKIAPQVTMECYKNGLIARPLPSVDSVAFSPPLVASISELDQIVDIFAHSLETVINAL